MGGPERETADWLDSIDAWEKQIFDLYLNGVQHSLRVKRGRIAVPDPIPGREAAPITVVQ
jgi:hypothetical protein